MNEQQLCHGYMSLRERVITDEPIAGFDLLVGCTNWESRSLSSIKRLSGDFEYLNIRFSDVPAPRATDALADGILDKLKLEDRFDELNLGAAVDVRENCRILHQELSPKISASKKVIIDITAIPKSYLLSIIGWCFAERRTPSLAFLYQEGDYTNSELIFPDVDGLKLGQFTTGNWTLMQVPYLEGGMEIDDRSRLVAYCGGDHERILAALESFENLDRWAVLTSATPKHPDTVARSHAKSIVDNSGIPQANILYSEPLSAIRALESITPIFNRAFMASGVGGIILPFSTKIHSLAAATLAVFHANMTVMVRRPESYVPRAIGAGSRAVFVEITDLSSPLAAAYL